MSDLARADSADASRHSVASIDSHIPSDGQVLSANPELCTDTPSRKHAISAEEERSMRVFGCELIQHAAIQLNLSTSTSATAQVLFHRFYFRQSMRKYSVERMAPACLYLAAKVEEQPQPISNVLEVFHYMACTRLSKPRVALCEMPDAIVGERRMDLTKMESLILTQLGFIIHTELPYKFICAYLGFLGLNANHELAQRAWNYANDVFRSDACVRYDAPTLACTCIHLAAADMSVLLPCDPAWWLVFNVSDVDIACVTMILQQLLDMPAASNVLEPPPPPAAQEAPNAAKTLQPARSTASAAASGCATEFGSDGVVDRREDKRDGARLDRGDGRTDRREEMGDSRGDRRGNYRDDRRGGSDDRRGGSDDRRGSQFDRDDGRGQGRDSRRDRDSGRGDDSRSYHRERDSSRERDRENYRERRDARTGDRSGDGRDYSRDGRSDYRRDDRRDDRIDGGQEIARYPEGRRDVKDQAHDADAEIKPIGDGDVKPGKSGRRTGRWDES